MDTLRKGKFYLDAWMEDERRPDGELVTRCHEVPGYTYGELWNGWACPYFTREAGMQILESLNASLSDYGLRVEGYYDRQKDAFVFPLEEGEDELYGVSHRDGLDLYPIGNYAWTWSELTEEEVAHNAKRRRYEGFLLQRTLFGRDGRVGQQINYGTYHDVEMAKYDAEDCVRNEAGSRSGRLRERTPDGGGIIDLVSGGWVVISITDSDIIEKA